MCQVWGKDGEQGRAGAGGADQLPRTLPPHQPIEGNQELHHVFNYFNVLKGTVPPN